MHVLAWRVSTGCPGVSRYYIGNTTRAVGAEVDVKIVYSNMWELVTNFLFLSYFPSLPSVIAPLGV